MSKANKSTHRIFCTALPLFVHLLNTKGHLYNGPSSPNVSSPSLSLQDVGVQCSRNPNWARRIIKCLGLHFRDELEYILQAVKAVNNSLTESLQESQESPILFAQEEEMQIGNWRELLDTRPRLYVRLIKKLDNVISWGGPLPETNMVAPFNEYQIPPCSGMTRQFQAEKPSLKWTPPVSSASARRNIKQRTPSMSYGDEPAAQLEVGETDSGCLHPEGLRESFSDILMQKLDLPQSCLDEAYSPTSLDPSRRIWAEKIAGSDRRVLDQVASREEIKPTAIDFTDADDMILVDGLSDEWIDALLQSDSAG
ncbi:Oxygen-dependent choline dehydrogenase [Fusarium oxysporum f. sp. albedinis]|nr:Oxygen-dependent choline dehydrogenase [Fusarium oxysporum f. sp. albedinis]